MINYCLFKLIQIIDHTFMDNLDKAISYYYHYIYFID